MSSAANVCSDAAEPVISIVIPAFNADATISETLESALSQREVTCEIIVVDDGSSDTTLARIAPWSKQVAVLTGPNRGASAARNSGIAAARGAWLLFLDADDILTPGTLGRRLADAAGRDVVICDWTEIDERGHACSGRREVDFKRIERDAQVAFASSEWATTAAVLYRKSLVEKVGGFRADLPVIQDARFAFDIARLGARYSHSQHEGARYRVVRGSLSRRNPERFYLDVLSNILQIENLWRKDSELAGERLKVVRDGLNIASRGLLGAGSTAFFEVLEHQKRLGGRPLHAKVAEPLARCIGPAGAGRLLSLLGKT
jgi:glycosyltransferase involved in cell wall biosynthesis